VSIVDKRFLITLSTLFLAVIGIASYLQIWYLALIIPVVFACYLLIQHPIILFYLLIATIPWSAEISINQQLGTDIPDEPLMVLAASFVVFYFFNNRSLIKSIRNPILWILLLQVIWTLCSDLYSIDKLASIKYSLAKGWYLLAFVAAPLILWNDKKRLVKTFLILLGSMMLVFMVIFIRHYQANFTFATINKAVHPFFRNHVNYSSLLVCMVPILIAVLQIEKRFRILIFVALLITVAGVILSYARGAWLALVVGILSYWLIKHRILLKSFILILCFIVISGIYLSYNDNYINYSNNYKTTIFHTNFSEHLRATYQMKDLSTAERFYRWVAGVRMIRDSWITGFGPTTFYTIYKSYTQPAFKTWVSNNQEHSTIHNYFLLMIIEQGVIGLLLFLALLGSAFYQLEKWYRLSNNKSDKVILSSAASVLVMICILNFLSDLIETDKIGSLFYLGLSVIVFYSKRFSSSSHIKSISQTVTE
jgi:Lipid A core - O-antigen ligase and related enzymes